MGERWKLPKPHAALEISSSESKCSLLRRAYPNGGTVGAVKAERAAGNWFVREQMLAQAMPLLRRAHPNGRTVGAVKAARDAGSQFVREQMLAQAVPGASMRLNGGMQTPFFLPSSPLLQKDGVWGFAP